MQVPTINDPSKPDVPPKFVPTQRPDLFGLDRPPDLDPSPTVSPAVVKSNPTQPTTTGVAVVLPSIAEEDEDDMCECLSYDSDFEMYYFDASVD